MTKDEALQTIADEHIAKVTSDIDLAVNKALAQPKQEPVSWGVDWSKDGDIPCVSIIKRLPDGGMEAVAVEYGPPRPWVGLTNNELQPIADEYRILFGSWVEDFARAIEAKLREKNT